MRSLAKTDFPYAILEIVRTAEGFYLNPQEIDRQITAVDFWKSNSVLLSCDNRVSLPFLATVNRIEYFLLRKTVVVRKAAREYQLSPQLNQILFEAFWLRDPAE